MAILAITNTQCGQEMALLWQKEASDKSDISCKRANCVSFPLTAMEYHGVLPNISLRRMSVYANLA